MAKTAPESQPSIEQLLAERAQYHEWLAKLDAAGNRAPASVRDRVRTDYQTRLEGVIERLREHGATIAADLDRNRGTRTELDGRRAKMEEELAEAEIRYAVGEYDEAGWQQISERSGRELERLQAELEAVDAEIARLAEVQGLISTERDAAAAESGAQPATPAAAPAAASAASAVSTPRVPVETVDAPSGPPATPAAPRFVPRRSERDQAARGAPPAPAATRAPAPADEMAFLKSMSDSDEKEKRSPGRRSLDSVIRAGEGRAETERDDSPPQAAGGSRGGSPVAKTLKCADCGTLNRPTEWYCERCGAELAAM